MTPTIISICGKVENSQIFMSQIVHILYFVLYILPQIQKYITSSTNIIIIKTQTFWIKLPL